MPDYTGAGLYRCRIIQMPDYTGVGLYRCRIIQMPDYTGYIYTRIVATYIPCNNISDRLNHYRVLHSVPHFMRNAKNSCVMSQTSCIYSLL